MRNFDSLKKKVLKTNFVTNYVNNNFFYKLIGINSFFLFFFCGENNPSKNTYPLKLKK